MLRVAIHFALFRRYIPNKFICAAYTSSVSHDEDSSKLETAKSLMHFVTKPVANSGGKVSVIGCGDVGMACAFAILTQGVSSDLALVDRNRDKMMGETLDLQHGSTFMRNARIHGSSDYEVTTNSRICIVTAGARQVKGETRLNLVQRNVNVMKNIVSEIVKYSPNCIILIVTNPVDVLTYIAWKLSGLPKNQVLGSGTNLDSSRFRVLMSHKLGIAPSNCHSYIIGEHGDSSVAVWSNVNVAGVRIREINPNIGTDKDTEGWNELHKDVVQSAYEVIKLKGYTSWAIGVSISHLCSCILRNTNTVQTISVNVKGLHGIDKDVCLSLPTVLGEKGVVTIIKQRLGQDEIEKLHKSANILHDTIKSVKM